MSIDYHVSVDLDRPGGFGPLWGIASQDLNATLLSWGPGDGVEEHRNDERDVLLIVISGSGTVVIDSREHHLAGHHVLLIERGSRRRIEAGAQGLRYVSVHRRRGLLQIELPAADDAAPAGDER